jgi:hypothetical protein
MGGGAHRGAAVPRPAVATIWKVGTEGGRGAKVAAAATAAATKVARGRPAKSEPAATPCCSIDKGVGGDG